MSEPLEPKVYGLQDIIERASVSTAEAERDFPGLRTLVLICDPIGAFRYRATNWETTALVQTTLRLIEVLHLELVRRLSAPEESSVAGVSDFERDLDQVELEVDRERPVDVVDGGLDEAGVSQAHAEVNRPQA